MTFPLEYHNVVKCPVQRAVPAWLALFGMLLFPLLFVSSSLAQISATSNTSNSGHSFSVAPPTGAVVPPTGSVVPNTGDSFITATRTSTGVPLSSPALPAAKVDIIIIPITAARMAMAIIPMCMPCHMPWM